jgi:two-component system KDP operon response regulator KdpE
MVDGHPEGWGMGYEGELHMLRVNTSNLRRKIELDSTRPTYIHTERSVVHPLWAMGI